MSIERDSYGIYHIDGPPYAGFDVVDGNAKVEVRYKLLIYMGTKKECEEAYESLMTMVRSELQELTSNNIPEGTMVRPIIWWRRRFELVQDMEDPGRWKFSCRFDTTPPLLPDFWDRWGCREGELARKAKDVL